MKNKLVMGIFSLLFGGFILISLIIPWWNESFNVFGLSGVFYPLSIPTLPKSDPVYLSYITGILILISGITAIAFGIIMILKKKGRNSNLGSIVASIIGIMGFIFYIIFIYKISPDVNGNIFYYSNFVESYRIQAGFYVEVVSSVILFISGLIAMS